MKGILALLTLLLSFFALVIGTMTLLSTIQLEAQINSSRIISFLLSDLICAGALGFSVFWLCKEIMDTLDENDSHQKILSATDLPLYTDLFCHWVQDESYPMNPAPGKVLTLISYGPPPNIISSLFYLPNYFLDQVSPQTTFLAKKDPDGSMVF